MIQSAGSDTLFVINGPEDGAEFPVVRGPFTIGHDGGCGVCLRLDNGVQSVHARGTCSSDGYRIRGTTSAPIYVNDVRAGLVRSRVLKHGDILRVGHTELMLECAPGGLARRSAGMVAEHDAVWAIRRGSAFAWKALRGIVTFTGRSLFFLRLHWRPAVVAGLIAAYFLLPSLHGGVVNLWNAAAQVIQDLKP